MEQNRWQKIRIPYPTERGYLPLTSTMWLGFTNGILADTTWRWNVPAWWGLLSCASDIAMTSSSLGSQLVQAIWETHGQTWTRPTTFNCPAGLDQLTHRCVINTCLPLYATEIFVVCYAEIADWCNLPLVIWFSPSYLPATLHPG